MRVVISHDVDHIGPWEHRTDLIVPKFVVRFGIEWLVGSTRFREVRAAIASLCSGKWQNTEELMDFDEAHGVPSTFFVAVANGRKLHYSLDEARRWITRIAERGFDVGVHGIEYRDFGGVSKELALFRNSVNQDVVGIRIHGIGYSPPSVVLTDSDVLVLRDAGYSYSTSTFGEGRPWSSGTFWEFPIHLMDGNIFEVGHPWKTRTLAQAKESTIEQLRRAADKDVPYFSLLFHDGYFADYHQEQKDWYMWVVEYVKTEGYPLRSYRDAVRELNEAREADVS